MKGDKSKPTDAQVANAIAVLQRALPSRRVKRG